jgi:alkylated DNA nucleotide flippase Atl1
MSNRGQIRSFGDIGSMSGLPESGQGRAIYGPLRTGERGPWRRAILDLSRLDLSRPKTREGPTAPASIQNNSGLPQGLAGHSAVG